MFRPLLSFLLLIGYGGLALEAQEKPSATPPASPQWVNYKSFTNAGLEIRHDHAAGRLEWWRQRMGGDLGPDFMQRVIREAERARDLHPQAFRIPGAGAVAPAASTPSGTWVNLGPTQSDFTQNGITLHKVDSGRIRAVLPHPTDPNTVYVFATGGGFWKTENFLSANPTWVPLSDFVGSTMGGSAAFGRDPGTIYLAMGEPAESVGVGGFVVRSTNAGTSWGTAAFMGNSTRVYDLKVDTSVGTTSNNDIVLCATNTGVFRSTNGGSSFTAVPSFTGVRGCSLARTSAGWLAAVASTSTGAGSLFISADKGATWSPITNAGGVISNIGRVTLGVGQPGDSVVYCFASNTRSLAQRDLFRSTDGGQTWTALGLPTKTPTNPNGDLPDMNVMKNQAWFNQMVLVDPTDSSRNTVYLGGQFSTAKSTDGGATWTVLSSWLPGGRTGTSSLPYVHADHHSAAFSTAGGNRLFFGTDGGLFTSTDGGLTWDDTKNKGIVSHLFYSLTSSPLTAGSVLGGLQDNGTRIRVTSPSPTGTFNQIKGGDGFGAGWSQANQATTLVSYVNNDISRSTANPPTGQASFDDFMTGLPDPVGNADGSDQNYYFVTPITTPTAAADPTGTVFFTYGNNGDSAGVVGPGARRIYKSNATGWTTIGTAGVGGLSAGRFVRALSHGIGVHPTDINRIGAAGNGGNILLTTNGGTTWTETFLGSTGTDGQNIGWVGFNSNVAWANNNLLYVCAEAVAAGATRVARSANGGSSWVKADNGLPDVPVSKLVVDPADSTGNTVYAATWIGVYATTNGGTSWSPLGAGFPQVPVSDLYLSPTSGFLRASTYGRGIWELGGGSAPAGPAIQVHPANQTVTAPASASFSVTATGTGTLTYQWQKDGSDIPLANLSAYTTPPTSVADNGAQFRVRVTDSAGNTLSNPATLTVNSCGGGGTTQVLQNPGFESGDSIWVAENTNIFDNAVDPSSHTGTWKAWLGSYSSTHTDYLYQTLSISPSATAADLSFYLTIGNSSGTPSAVTNVMTLKVRNSSGVDITSLATWNNTQANYPTYALQGPYNLLPYKGQTVQIYLTSVQPGGSGTGTGFLVDDFTLNVTTGSTAALPVVSSHPVSQTLTVGQPATFTVATSAGTPPLTYQWRKNSVAIPGATNATYNIASAQAADSGSYDVQISNCAGTATSNAAILTVNEEVTVSIVPSSTHVVVGGQLSFTALVTGSSNTAVSWHLLGGGGTLINANANPVTFQAPSTPSLTELIVNPAANPSAMAFVFITTWQGDIFDLATIARAWGSHSGDGNWNALADLNGDGTVDASDLTLFYTLAGF
jgi:photosystem II stability/assembly factor-like uncharacterized protein